MPASSSRIKLLIAFITLYLVWGSTYLAIRFAVATLPPFLMAAFRFLVAGSLMYGWCRLRGAPSPRREEWRSAGLVGTLLLGGGNGLVVWAEQRVSSGLTALLVASVPVWIVVLDWIRPGGTAPRKRALLGVLLGLAGMVYLVAPWNPETFGEGKALDVWGVAALALSTMCWASGSLASRHLPFPKSPFLSTGMEMIMGGVFLIVLGSTFGEWHHAEWGLISASSVWAWAYLIVFGSLVGFTAYIWLLRNTQPAQATTYAFINPIVALVLGWAIAGEPLTARVWIAAAVILTAVAMILRK